MIRKILYVDDDVESRIMVADYLRYLGHEVITVEEAGHALRAARENQVSVMLLDVNLVGLDGPELMEQLRREHPSVPIVLYSGMNADDEKVRKMLADGASRFLSKNEPLDELVKTLHGVLN